MRRLVTLFAAFMLWFAPTAANAVETPSKCTGHFVNPITDVCWGCLFPLSIGALKIWDYPIFCAGDRLSSDHEPFAEDHGELALGLTPLPWRSFPFVRRVIEYEV